MSFGVAQWEGREVIVLRSGYTGEKGFELVPRWDDTPALWDALVEAMKPYDGLPCGLGARDTLRTEMGYPLHGNELSMKITPNMARAGWAVGRNKDAFWGKEALAAQKEAGGYRLTWGLKATGRGIPRAHCEVKNADGAVVGEVTSGTMSPTLKVGIAIALMDRGTQEGDEVVIDVRGRELPAVVVKPPFVQTEVD
jgi:Glycine cleavage system T protein (aminomethyltransferase)